MTMDMDLYVENVDSFVKDDDKLVTYKWLSKELEIHVNVAKDILQHYYDSHKDNVVATFLIKGQLEDGSLRMEVTRAADLDVAKQKFSRLDFEHIYSVQKSLPDIELLATADNGDVRFSAIKLEKCPLRTDVLPRAKSVEKKIEKVEINNVKQSDKKVEENIKIKVDEKTNKEEKENKNKEEEKEEKDKTTSKKVESTKSNTKSAKKPIQSTQAGFKNLFGKVPNQKKIDVAPKTSTLNEEKQVYANEEKKYEKPIERISPKESKSPIEKSKSDLNKNASLKTSQSKKRTRSPAKKESSSKRKRIVMPEDSSEDEEMKSDHSENEEEPEEVVEDSKAFTRKSPTPEREPTQNGKVKIRKIITQSYEDEDGYVLTKQVTVTEEVDAEPEPEPKPKPKKVEPPKKQASITSFFKRS